VFPVAREHTATKPSVWIDHEVFAGNIAPFLGAGRATGAQDAVRKLNEVFELLRV
jgi:hypothetical protein